MSKIKYFFAALMYYFAAAQQTNIAKFLFVSLKESLRVNETKPDTKNACNWNNFGVRVKNKSKINERAMFRVSLKNHHLYLDEV